MLLASRASTLAWWAMASLLARVAFCAEAAQPPATFAAATRGFERLPGLLDVYRDVGKGRVLLGVRTLDTPMLMFVSLPYGLGSNDVGLDRGANDRPRVVEFRRAGSKLLLVEINTRYIASAESPQERAAVVQAFPQSVLWAGEILATDSANGATSLIDLSSFLLTDRNSVVARLTGAQQGAYAVDDKRSVVMAGDCKNFPDNTELEALLTFQGPGEGEWVRQVAMEPQSLTLRQHVSFVRRPRPGFTPRRYHPASGAFSIAHVDYSQPLAESLDVRYQPRFRLEKTDPGAPLSPVKKPIVFYVDSGAPEPVRSALLAGANGWRTAFEKAGFKDAFRAEAMPADMDPSDVRYSTVLWTHRATRGWSYGLAMVDPDTAEIVKGAVTLGSQRVRQDILIAESLLAPYGGADSAERKQLAEQMALSRLRQLAAHEVGHALGFAHNFAASRQGNGSVMDYPHPVLSVEADGRIALNRAYGSGVGPWDDFLVKHAYGQFPAARENAALAELRAQVSRAGLEYVSDEDSRAPGSVHPDGLLWDFGPSTQQTFDLVMKARRAALERFSPAVLAPERPLGELEARLVPVYLLHRYQVEAVARQIAGATYRYGLAGDTPPGSTAVPATQQRAALRKLLTTLTAEELALPQSLLDILTPPGNDYSRTREYFITRTGQVFDAFAAVEAAAGNTTQFLLDPARLNRLAWQHARDATMPGVSETLDETFRSTWLRGAIPASIPAGEAVQLAADWVVLDALLGAIDSGQLHAPVEAQVRGKLRQWAKLLEKAAGDEVGAHNRREAADYLTHYLADPKSVRRRPPPAIPPGAPI